MADKKPKGAKRAPALRAERNLQNVRQWLGFGYCAAMLALFPLFFSPNTYYTITTDKFAFFRACSLLFLALLLIGLGQAAMDGWRPALSIKGVWRGSSITQKLAALLALLWVLATVLSPLTLSEEVQGMISGNAWTGTLDRFNGLQTQLLYVLAFFLVLWCGFKHPRWILYGLAAVMVALSAVGIAQAWGYDPLGMYIDANRAVYTSFYSTIGNSNFVSGMLCLGVPVCAAAFVLATDKSRWLFLAAAVAGFYLLLAIQVDSGLVGMAACLLVLPLLCCNTPKRLSLGFWLLGALCCAALLWRVATPTGGPGGYFSVKIGFGKTALLFAVAAVLSFLLAALLQLRAGKINWTKKGMTRTLAVLLAAVLLTAAVAFCAVPLTPGAGFLYQGQQALLHGNWDDHFGSNRIFIWKRTPALVLDNPLLGTGAASFKGAFQEKYLEEVKAFSGNGSQVIVYDSAHNIYLDYAVECGLLGLACYLGVIVTLLARALRHKEEEPLLPILSCAILVYCAQGVFSFVNVVAAPVMWVMLGMLESLARQAERKALEAK